MIGTLVASTNNHLGIGKVAAMDGDSATVEYFESIGRRSRLDLPLSSLRRVRLAPQQRCYLQDGEPGRWIAGRIGNKVDSEYEVLFPDKGARYVEERAIYVRCAGPLVDPVETLAAYGHETAFFHLHRSGFVRSLLRQRASSRGLTGLLSSRIGILPHQVEVVRRVLEDPVQRYLLADEVGLGKTIEAGIVLRQFLLDEPRGRALIVTPPFLVEQWREELEDKFRVSQFGDRVRLVGADAIDGLAPDAEVGLLIVDEAHHLAALAGVHDPGERESFGRLAALAHGTDRLLLLSATPALNHEHDFLAMLHLLDPAAYRLDDLDSFRHRVQQRQEIGRLLLPLMEGAPSFVLKRTAERLRAAFPGDADLEGLIQRLLGTIAVPGPDPVGRDEAVRAIRGHVGETYRLHRRMLRSRRSTAADGALAGRRNPEVFGQVVSEFDLDDEGEALHGLLDEWRVAALAAIPAAASEERDVVHAQLTGLYRILFECAGTWPQVLGAVSQARLARHVPEGCAMDLEAGAAEAVASIPLFPGEEEILGAMVRAAAEPGSGGRLGLLEQLLAPSARRAGSRETFVVFTSFPSASREIVRHLSDRLGTASVAGYHLGMSGTEVEAQVRRFRDSAECFVLVCDRSGEEGRNLQMADWLIHFDLPLAPNRIEQRIGRLDRIGRGRAVRTRILLGPEVEPSAFEAWFRLLHDGFRVFDGSIASLQFFVDERVPSVLEALFEGGPGALSPELAKTLNAEIAEEQVRLDEQSVLDEIDTRQPGAAATLDVSIGTLEADWGQMRQEMESWICGALQFQARRAGQAVQYVASRDRTLVSHDFLVRRFYPFARMRGTFDREAARGDVELYRAGHPFVDLFGRAVHSDDRGQAFAIWRSEPSWSRESGAEWMGFRFDYAVQTDLSPAREVLARHGVPQSGMRSLLRRADAFLPPSLHVVFTDTEGEEVTDPDVLNVLTRPFRRVRDGGSDTNLTKDRLPLLQRLVNRDAWAGVCRGARTASERSIREQPSFADNCRRQAAVAARELAVRVRILERRMARNEGDRMGTGRELSMERELAYALCRGITTPELRLDSVGFIVISGRGPHEEEV